MNLDVFYVFVYSYFLGSIPFGLIITKIFLGKDIRDIGSGNIGTTNVLRTGKKSLATATLPIDISAYDMPWDTILTTAAILASIVPYT